MQHVFTLLKPTNKSNYKKVLLGAYIVYVVAVLYVIIVQKESVNFIWFLLPIAHSVGLITEIFYFKKTKTAALTITESFITWQSWVSKEVTQKVVIWNDIKWIKKEPNEYVFYGDSSFATILPFNIIEQNQVQHLQTTIEALAAQKQIAIQ